MYVLSDQTDTGLVIYDLSNFMDGDPSNNVDIATEGPPILGIKKSGAFGGYWPDVFGYEGKLYAIAPYRTDGNGLRIVDITDPDEIGEIIDIEIKDEGERASSMYCQFQDHYAFTGGAKIDVRPGVWKQVLQLKTKTVEHVDGPRIVNTGKGIDTSQWLLPLGNLVITGGYGHTQGNGIWVHDEEKDTQPPTVGFHIPKPGETNYPIEAPTELSHPRDARDHHSDKCRSPQRDCC